MKESTLRALARKKDQDLSKTFLESREKAELRKEFIEDMERLEKDNIELDGLCYEFSRVCSSISKRKNSKPSIRALKLIGELHKKAVQLAVLDE